MMPRVSFSQVRKTYANRLLAPLLNATKSLNQAENELRWIKQELPEPQWRSAVARRGRLEPLQYILGSQPFGPLDIKCSKNVLIPRWETEDWVLKLAERAKSWGSLRVLDVCTGSGCVALLLKKQLPNAKVEAIDISEDAVALAEENKVNLGLEVEVRNGDVLQHDMYSQLWGDTKFDIVVSNPPYIPRKDYEAPVLANGTELSVKLYEPELALVGHLEFYKALVHNVVEPLQCNAFVFELGYEDQAEYTKLLLQPGWETATLKDSAGNLRCIYGWRKPFSFDPPL